MKAFPSLNIQFLAYLVEKEPNPDKRCQVKPAMLVSHPQILFAANRYEQPDAEGRIVKTH
jgi:hypothetical protein